MRVFTVLLIFMNSLVGFSQDEKANSAVLVIDIQDFYFPGGDVPLAEPQAAAKNAFLLISHFRQEEMPVIFIRHVYEPGGSINDTVKPLEGEKIFSKNNVNAFLDTELDSYLIALGIRSLVICGMQTHMCVEAATRAASDLGYKCTVIEDACTTRDLNFKGNIVLAKDVHYSTLSTLRSYARVVSTSEYLGNKE